MQQVYLSLNDIILFLVLAVIVIAFIYNVYVSSFHKRLMYEYIPTSEELARDLMRELIGNKDVFKKFILPIMGLDAKAEKDIAATLIQDNPIMIALEALQPALADRIKDNPRLLLQLPTAIARINPKWGALLSDLLGVQFNVLGLLGAGQINIEEANRVQQEATQTAVLKAQGYSDQQITQMVKEQQKATEEAQKAATPPVDKPISAPQNPPENKPINTPESTS